MAILADTIAAKVVELRGLLDQAQKAAADLAPQIKANETRLAGMKQAQDQMAAGLDDTALKLVAAQKAVSDAQAEGKVARDQANAEASGIVTKARSDAMVVLRQAQTEAKEVLDDARAKVTAALKEGDKAQAALNDLNAQIAQAEAKLATMKQAAAAFAHG